MYCLGIEGGPFLLVYQRNILSRAVRKNLEKEDRGLPAVRSVPIYDFLSPLACSHRTVTHLRQHIRTILTRGMAQRAKATGNVSVIRRIGYNTRLSMANPTIIQPFYRMRYARGLVY